MNKSSSYKYLLCIILSGIFSFNGNGQYFGGRNKPGYKTFNYSVYQTPHFEIYHYSKNDSFIKKFAESSEKWYLRHQKIFQDTFRKPNPLILYENHADFQQTSAISGNIGVGTGGVTESLKNRVVMPVMESWQQTDHVLGHELVHAFQYQMLLSDDSTGQRSFRNIPLWMVEGMAEYLSIGSFDPFTSMWMRDALLNNDFPTLDEMTRSYKYFPYRYGQAFWVYFTGLYGDSIIKPMFDLTTKLGYEKAIDSITHLNEKGFSAAWKQAMKNHFFKYMPDTIEVPAGKLLIDEKNAGESNIAPSISPDGKYFIFLSEKDLFTFDLFLSNAETGKIIKKISSTIRENKIDDFNFLESGGTWSPNSRYFAFVVFSEGVNKLLVIDIKHPRKSKELAIPGLDAFSNPSWSPDGKSIVVTGLVDGYTDLFLYNIEKNTCENLTNDDLSNLQPSWSPDGNKIVFITDLNKDGELGHGYDLAIYNLESRSQTNLKVYEGSENLNPQFSPDGRFVYFVSDIDGYRNLHKYDFETGVCTRMTRLLTGITGITSFTPAYTIDRSEGRIIYTHYYNNKYRIYRCDEKELMPDTIILNDSFRLVADAIATLPPFKRNNIDIVNPGIVFKPEKSSLQTDSFKKVEYKSKFKLDYIGSSGVGVAINSYYGTGVAGSVDMLFSDIVGHNTIYSSLSINGEVYDFGGMVAFINSKYKIDFGMSLSHIPYINGNYNIITDSIVIDGKVVERVNYAFDYYRIFEDQLGLFFSYPLSQTQRIELGSSLSHYAYRLDRYNNYYIGNFNEQNIDRNIPHGQKSFFLNNANIAYTLDNAYFGIASPLRGQRFRAEFERYIGNVELSSVLMDFRRYIFLKPMAIAYRFYHVNRFGNDEDNGFIFPLYPGYPWLVRGFENSFYTITNDLDNLDQAEKLFGSRMIVSNLEFRFPFTGPDRLCLISSRYLFTELSLFADAGVTWNKKLVPEFTKTKQENDILTLTSGISLRINILGALVLEPYYAMPLTKNGLVKGSFGFNFLPGW